MPGLDKEQIPNPSRETRIYWLGRTCWAFVHRLQRESWGLGILESRAGLEKGMFPKWEVVLERRGTRREILEEDPGCWIWVGGWRPGMPRDLGQEELRGTAVHSWSKRASCFNSHSTVRLTPDEQRQHWRGSGKISDPLLNKLQICSRLLLALTGQCTKG